MDALTREVFAFVVRQGIFLAINQTYSEIVLVVTRIAVIAME